METTPPRNTRLQTHRNDAGGVRAYVGRWDKLPEFDSLEPESTSALPNGFFDIPRGEEVLTGEVSHRLVGAQPIERALAPQFSAPSIKSLAAEGTPSRWYQSLEEFESAALESLGS